MGTIPARLLRRLSSLQVLNLGNNKMTGTLPVEIEHLSNLRTLTLDANSWIGVIPTQLGAIESLGTLAVFLASKLATTNLTLL